VGTYVDQTNAETSHPSPSAIGGHFSGLFGCHFCCLSLLCVLGALLLGSFFCWTCFVFVLVLFWVSLYMRRSIYRFMDTFLRCGFLFFRLCGLFFMCDLIIFVRFFDF